jgi:hypothetical protein
MLEPDEALVDGALTASCYAVARWRQADPAFDAQVLHHALHLLGDAGIPPQDPLLTRLESAVVVAPDFGADFGLYCSALAAVGHFRDHATTEAQARLGTAPALGGTQSRRSPYDRQTLERLLVIEALCSRGLDVRPTDMVRREIDRTLARDLSDATPADRSYPLSLQVSIGDGLDHSNVTSCFESVLEQYQRGALWYDDLRFDSLVLLNAARSRTVISDELYAALWDEGLPLLRSLLALSDVATSDMDLLNRPAYLAQIAPYARALLAAPHEGERRYTDETAAWIERAYAIADAERHSRSDEERSIEEALCDVIRKSLIVSSTIAKISGGFSSSTVYSAVLDVEQPFRISGARVIFKTDISPREREAYGTLERLGLHRLFARVLSEPTFVTMSDGSRQSVFVYEHLAPMVTLRSVLEEPVPLPGRMALVKSVVSRVGRLWDDQAIDPVRSDFADIRRSILRVAADLFLVNVPAIKTEVQNLVNQTQQIVDAIDFEPILVRAVVHGDLNCRNIMLETSEDGGAHRLKVIDYETILLGGDPLIDIGELMEDVHHACGLSADDVAAESTVLDALSPTIAARLSARDPQMRLLLCQIRSCCTLTKLALSDSTKRPTAIPLMSRWHNLVSRLDDLTCGAV